jgi:hypothetical protein
MLKFIRNVVDTGHVCRLSSFHCYIYDDPGLYIGIGKIIRGSCRNNSNRIIFKVKPSFPAVDDYHALGRATTEWLYKVVW